MLLQLLATSSNLLLVFALLETLGAHGEEEEAEEETHRANRREPHRIDQDFAVVVKVEDERLNEVRQLENSARMGESDALRVIRTALISRKI